MAGDEGSRQRFYSMDDLGIRFCIRKQLDGIYRISIVVDKKTHPLIETRDSVVANALHALLEALVGECQISGNVPSVPEYYRKECERLYPVLHMCLYDRHTFDKIVSSVEIMKKPE